MEIHGKIVGIAGNEENPRIVLMEKEGWSIHGRVSINLDKGSVKDLTGAEKISFRDLEKMLKGKEARISIN